MWNALPLLAVLAAAAATAAEPAAPAPGEGARVAPKPPAARVQPIVIAQRYALETGFGALAGEHVLRFPAPAPARLRALPIGGQVTVPALDVSGATTLSAEDGPERWEKRYPAASKAGAGAVLTIARTPAGFLLSTAIFMEPEPFSDPDPRAANQPLALRAACRTVLAQGVSFLVETLDPVRLPSERGAYSADGEWTETRRCRGKVSAVLGVDEPPAPPASAQPAP